MFISILCFLFQVRYLILNNSKNRIKVSEMHKFDRSDGNGSKRGEGGWQGYSCSSGSGIATILCSRKEMADGWPEEEKRGKQNFSRNLQWTRCRQEENILWLCFLPMHMNNPNASRQEIRAHLGATKPHSPLKSQVKDRLVSALAENDMRGEELVG